MSDTREQNNLKSLVSNNIKVRVKCCGSKFTPLNNIMTFLTFGTASNISS